MQIQRVQYITDDLVVTLAAVKAHLNVEHDDDDALITEQIAASVAFAESRLDRSLRLIRLKAIGPCWPVRSGRYMFPLNGGPVRQVEAVEYIDGDGATQSIASDQWELTPHNGSHMFNFLETPPATQYGSLSAVSVTYLTGYGFQPDAMPDEYGFPYTLPLTIGYSGGTLLDDIYNVFPEQVRHAIYLMVGGWYENRESVVVGVVSNKLAFAVDDLLQQHRVLGV